MTARSNVSKAYGFAKTQMRGMRKGLGSTGKGLIAGATGAALFLSNLGNSVRSTAVGPTKKSREVLEMRKSTVIALLVALAAVAGVLGALYFYVLRREKELDEYEQLLFSEDFNDDELEPEADEDEE